MNQRKAVGYGRGEVAIDVPEPTLVEARTLKERLLTTFRSPNYRPPVLPAVATELLALSRRADVGFQDVTKTLERDPMLAAAVLRLAQSPAYATRIAPSSLLDAVQRLGLLTVRDMVFQVVVGMRVFRAPGYDTLMEKLRRHSILTAHATRLICTRTALASEQAFLCGLLHDVGFSGVLLALTDLPIKERPPLSAMISALSDMHDEAGAMMARIWELAPDIQLVLQKHHDFDRTRMPHPLIAAVTYAEALAADHGAGLSIPLDGLSGCEELAEALDRPRPERVDAAVQFLGLTPTTRTLIERECAALATKVLS